MHYLIPFNSHDKYVQILYRKVSWLLSTRESICQWMQESCQQEHVNAGLDLWGLCGK